MMIKNFILLFLVLSLKASAYSFLYGDQKDINLDNTMLERYIKPQLKAMVSEYYQTLATLHPLNPQLIKLKELAQKASIEWKNWNKHCNTWNESCVQDLKKIKKIQRDLEVQTTSLQKQIFDRSFFLNQFFTDSLFLLSSDLDELSILNYKTIDAMDMISILAIDSKLPLQSKTDLIEDNINMMQLLSEKILTELLPKTLKRQYFELWFFFVKDLERYLTSNNSDTFFLNRLEYFNQNWNSFHMLLSKHIVQAPQSTLNTLSIMHNRWNSVLKIILKNSSKTTN
ncbi:MAG: hypothetical protein A2381_07285 [Bdellovibrionales bacterium RIFOXYB1_FULL_37_110]|nr:MAG: hypothetical protein A2181_06705 [Bdellovibrionales bacterium RIFOXYA1_FULL_38_20]OFZ45492.1 MAG: hypothetical protein A2417_18185 [Bdellovibrionales bacterium RIFOXYC1_FULL_37_79]OFZ60639.1 MAG: hypothetical protein A2381_07285 [Bdellovibrionales bacterium RIFOXYB1_FULL_37_110]OFZ63417.1 MAG: hypothetical protein A2328_09710 [Bdellovibrionales bacterium RIFOXYB2_FULL_36_6]OFZ63445.1 MAG: hypothetical protein A2577_06150 [Bdellovibrionales bacterium RIFOXYD1_FULL_36_51]